MNSFTWHSVAEPDDVRDADGGLRDDEPVDMSAPLWRILDGDETPAGQSAQVELNRLAGDLAGRGWPTGWVAVEPAYGRDQGQRAWFGFGSPPVVLMGVGPHDAVAVPCRDDPTYTDPSSVGDSVTLVGDDLNPDRLREVLNDLAALARAHRTWCVQCGRFAVASETTGWCEQCERAHRGVIL